MGRDFASEEENVEKRRCFEKRDYGDRCCLLVLDSVTSAPQCIRQPRPRVYLKEGTYHTRLFRGPSTNGMKKWDGPSRSWPTPHTTPLFLPRNCGPIRGLEYCMREIVHLCEIRTGHCRGIT
jgi:hypothetical protein